MIETRHDRRCLDILHATSVRDFTRQIIAFTQHLGFNNVGAIVAVKHSNTLTEFKTITNAPAAYLNEFHNLEHASIDPVSEHCIQSSSPIVWNRQTYKSAGVEQLWQLQEPYGYRSGLAVAMHFARGRHFVFGGNWDKDACDKVPHFRAIAEDLLSFAAHAQAAAFELTLPSAMVPNGTFSLAKRELEVLGWTADGLTSWQVADRMSISERHVALLVQRAMQKLSCSSRYEACLRAIRLGLLQCQ
jgi:DNA-binding CsgD family transcriptional regulator